MTQMHNMSIIFAAVGLKLTCGAILLSWFWPERAFIRVFHFSLTPFSAWKYDDMLLDAKEEDNFKVILQIMNYLSTPHLFLHANEEIRIKSSLRHKLELFGHYFTDTGFLMTEF